MKRDKTPHIKRVKINGYARYRLTFWTAEGRHREHYSKESAARKRLDELTTERKKFGEAVQHMSPALRADAVAAAEILQGSGYTLVEAARKFMDSLGGAGKGVDLGKAAESFIKSRDNRDDAYRRDLKTKIDQFVTFRTGRTVASITVDDCQTFLDGIAGLHAPGTVTNYRTALGMFFKFAQARGWCTLNPATLTTRPEEIAATITILTPAEATAVLRVCPAEILPGVALQLFCGIRAAEIERLDWSAVQRNEVEIKDETPTPAPTRGKTKAAHPAAPRKRVFYTITVTAQTSKKRTGRRVVEIPDCALTWLPADKKRKGKIWPAKERGRNLWELARVLAGYGPYATDYKPTATAQLDKRGKPRKNLRPWPDNALRRSAISYHLAKTNDLPRVAYQAGNSPKVIQEHYNGVALPQAAAEFYEITR
jgi:integrase